MVRGSHWLLRAMLLGLMLFAMCSSEAQQRVHIVGCATTRKTLSMNTIGTMCFIGTGNPVLNRILKADCTELRKLFKVDAVMILLDEANEPNAFASDTVYPNVIKGDGLDPEDYLDGTVFVGIHLIKDEFANSLNPSDAVTAILGHEFAHIMQNKRKFPYRGKWRELHADFMAGWFTAHRGRSFPSESAQPFLSLFRKDDFGFFSRDYHGNPNERSAAFLAGFQLNASESESSASVAYRRGVDYVKRQGGTLDDID